MPQLQVPCRRVRLGGGRLVTGRHRQRRPYSRRPCPQDGLVIVFSVPGGDGPGLRGQ